MAQNSSASTVQPPTSREVRLCTLPVRYCLGSRKACSCSFPALNGTVEDQLVTWNIFTYGIPRAARDDWKYWKWTMGETEQSSSSLLRLDTSRAEACKRTAFHTEGQLLPAWDLLHTFHVTKLSCAEYIKQRPQHCEPSLLHNPYASALTRAWTEDATWSLSSLWWDSKYKYHLHKMWHSKQEDTEELNLQADTHMECNSVWKYSARITVNVSI